MKRLAFLSAVLVGLLIPTSAFAAAVNADEYRREHGFSGRSDGTYQRVDTRGFDMFINGLRLNSLTKAVYEDFTEYGDNDVTHVTSASVEGGGCMQTDFTTPAANQGDIDLCTMPSGNIIAVFQLTAQTIGIDMDAGSLDISGDQVNGEGMELALGAYGATGAPFVVGKDPAFFACAKLSLADASGTSELWVGFRSLEAFNTTWNSYDSYVSIGLDSAAIKIETELEGASAASTDTTEVMSDGGTDTYCVYISGAGVVTYTIDGHPPTTTAALTYTDAESVIPILHIKQNADLTEEADFLEWKVGYATAPF